MASVESIMSEKYNKILQSLIPVGKFPLAEVLHNAPVTMAAIPSHLGN